jgi:alpha-beta hydrolase superfamily lysophospholipase
MTIRGLLRWLVRIPVALAIVVATILLVRAFDSRSLPELEVWHRTVLQAEFTQADAERIRTLKDYLDNEDRLFEELQKTVYARTKPSAKTVVDRYVAGSLSDPGRFPRNWNRSFELTPEQVRGGVLMLHGLTDSPYSVRRLAKIFEAQGFYVLALRMPGHGTVPGALTTATWQDWMAAARLGARHVREKVPKERPFYLLGYSNGGALAVKYTMDSLRATDLATPDRVFLFSPMIGVTRFAMFSDWHKALSWLPYFEKFPWLDVYPEYDPFKYNSFPKAAGEQTFLLTQELQQQVDQLVEAGKISELPPLLAFQSLTDATVLTAAIVDSLYGKLTANGSELVLFDVNRLSGVQQFLRPGYDDLLDRTIRNRDRTYTLTVVTNAHSDSMHVIAKTMPAGTVSGTDEDQGLTWPRGTYSLSHVAIPIPPDDPLYGVIEHPDADPRLKIGDLSPRGEKQVLTVPIDLMMRLRHNPFFEYMEKRLIQVLEEK